MAKVLDYDTELPSSNSSRAIKFTFVLIFLGKA